MFTTTRTADARTQFKAIERTIVRQSLQASLSKATLERNQLLAAPPPRVRKHGFDVPGAITDDFATQVKLQQVTDQVENAQQWLGAMDALETDLTTLGLSPIALLPVNLWRHLTRQAQVYRFEHFGKDGAVPAQPLGSFANLKLRLDTMPTLELVAKLWPNFHDSIDTGIRVTPYFPQAPEHFQQNLLRLMGIKYPVHVAAVPEAITVSRKEVLDAHVKANLVPPAPAPAQPDDDPILYTSSADGRLVALLDYFGHFPQEEVLVQRAQAWHQSIQQGRRR